MEHGAIPQLAEQDHLKARQPRSRADFRRSQALQRGQRFVDEFDADERIAGVFLAGAAARGTALAAESGVVARFAVERIFPEAADQQVIAESTSPWR